MTVQKHAELTMSILITKLSQHQIILGKPWMKKYGVILDMRNYWLSFWPRHCQHIKPHAKPLHAKRLNKKLNTKAPHAEKPRAKEPPAGKPMKILKQPTNKLPKLLPYLLSST